MRIRALGVAARAAARPARRRLRQRRVARPRRTRPVDLRADSAEAAAFPATVAHKYGETVVPEEPERVVSVGVTEQDILLAARRGPGRRDRVVRRPAGRHLAVGARPARGHQPRGAQHRRRPRVREDRGARAGPDRRHQRGPDREGLRAALGDRADDHQRRGLDPVLLVVAGPDPPDRPSPRPRGGRPGDRRRPRRRRTPTVAAAHPEWAGHDRDVLAGRPVRRPPVRLPGRAQHRLPHRPRLHDDDRPGGVRRPRRARRPRSPPRTSA